MHSLTPHVTPSAFFSLLSNVTFGQDAPPQSVGDLWQIIQEQQSRIEQLEQQSEATEAKATVNEQKVDATGDYLESLDENTSTLAG